jgi:YqaJ-like viral recombinase domain
MARGRAMESAVLSVVSKKYGISVARCGLILEPSMPIFGSSPDGLAEEYVIEGKCPTKKKTIVHYLRSGLPSPKVNAQIQLQMHFAQKKKELLCVAYPDFETSGHVDIVVIQYDPKYVTDMIIKATIFLGKDNFSKTFPVVTLCIQ